MTILFLLGKSNVHHLFLERRVVSRQKRATLAQKSVEKAGAKCQYSNIRTKVNLINTSSSLAPEDELCDDPRRFWNEWIIKIEYEKNTQTSVISSKFLIVTYVSNKNLKVSNYLNANSNVFVTLV